MGAKYSKECQGGEECHENQHLCKIVGRKDFNLLRDVKGIRIFMPKVRTDGPQRYKFM